MTHYRFADRMIHAPASFIDELFRVSGEPGVISFAGGLPDAALIDVEGIARAVAAVMEEEGRCALQYSTTDGYRPLREYIAARYRRRLGIPAEADDIQIVNGSQQCLDLMAKIFLNPGDVVGMERPGYLGAIEAFSLYEPEICTVPLDEEGPDLQAFAAMVRDRAPKFFYGIPNSQNPSGITYPEAARREIARLLDGTGTLFYEDDAFGDLFFDGRPREPVKNISPRVRYSRARFRRLSPPECGLVGSWHLSRCYGSSTPQSKRPTSTPTSSARLSSTVTFQAPISMPMCGESPGYTASAAGRCVTSSTTSSLPAPPARRRRGGCS